MKIPKCVLECYRFGMKNVTYTNCDVFYLCRISTTGSRRGTSPHLYPCATPKRLILNKVKNESFEHTHISEQVNLVK